MYDVSLLVKRESHSFNGRVERVALSFYWFHQQSGAEEADSWLGGPTLAVALTLDCWWNHS